MLLRSGFFHLKKYHLFLFYILLIFSLPQAGLTQINTYLTGKVTDGSNSISGAIVRVQATTITSITDGNGFFRLENVTISDSLLITAWKIGYYNGGTKIGDNSPVEIVLNLLPEKDNPDYEWVDPKPNPHDDIKNCGDCHPDFIYKQWSNNGHFRSAKNPIFLSFYNGTDAEGNEGVQPGFRLDYPYSNGNCSNCHAPAAAVKDFVGVDMNKLEGVEELGVSCDFCHKIRDIKLKDNFNINTGVMHIDLQRPPEGHQMFFGPYDDVPDPDAYSPIISKSIFCAPCHEGAYWGVPIYESYSEWLASPYSTYDIQCQDCHMPADGVTTNFAPDKGGMERDPMTIPTHLQLGSRDSSFLASSVEMQTLTQIIDDKLRVRVEITNSGAGHHIPTDQPMRNMILVVKAVDSNGNELKYIGENKVPFWGGVGNPSEGNYEGLPGKGFAKILFEPNPQYVSSEASLKGRHVFPAPQWRIIEIKEDNRIPALATDKSTYDFLISKAEQPITVTSELIYRIMFKNWATMKKLDLKDIPLAKNSAEVLEEIVHR